MIVAKLQQLDLLATACNSFSYNRLTSCCNVQFPRVFYLQQLKKTLSTRRDSFGVVSPFGVHQRRAEKKCTIQVCIG